MKYFGGDFEVDHDFPNSICLSDDTAISLGRDLLLNHPPTSTYHGNGLTVHTIL